MCHRFVVVDRAEALRIAAVVAADLAAHAGELSALDPIESYGPFLSRPAPDNSAAPREAYPQSVVALIAPTGHSAQLAVADMVWGFEVDWKQGAVFNTRIETALGSSGGMWADSLARRRCVVPVRRFFESHRTQTVPAARSGRPTKRPYAFERAGGGPLLLAGIHDKGRFSLVTTEPDAAVAPIHDRMPLTLSPDGAARWLAGDFRQALELPRPELAAAPER